MSVKHVVRCFNMTHSAEVDVTVETGRLLARNLTNSRVHFMPQDYSPQVTEKDYLKQTDPSFSLYSEDQVDMKGESSKLMNNQQIPHVSRRVFSTNYEILGKLLNHKF